MDANLFTRNFLREFITLFRAHETLWNPKSAAFDDRNAKNKAYVELTTKLQEILPRANRAVVISTIENLRSTFRNEWRRVKIARENNQSYKPSIWYYPHLLFLYGEEDQIAEFGPLDDGGDGSPAATVPPAAATTAEGAGGGEDGDGGGNDGSFIEEADPDDDLPSASPTPKDDFDFNQQTKEFVRSFIEIFRRGEALWNINSEDYTNRRKRSKVYEKLLTKLREVHQAATKNTVKKQLAALKTGFRLEMERIDTLTERGMGYTPKYWYFPLLSFLLEKDEIESDDETSSEGAVNDLTQPSTAGGTAGADTSAEQFNVPVGSFDHTYCRVCLSKEKPFISSLLSKAQMYEYCTGFKLVDNSKLPTNICSECEIQLLQCYQFKKQCEKNELEIFAPAAAEIDPYQHQMEVPEAAEALFKEAASNVVVANGFVSNTQVEIQQQAPTVTEAPVPPISAPIVAPAAATPPQLPEPEETSVSVDQPPDTDDSDDDQMSESIPRSYRPPLTPVSEIATSSSGMDDFDDDDDEEEEEEESSSEESFSPSDSEIEESALDLAEKLHRMPRKRRDSDVESVASGTSRLRSLVIEPIDEEEFLDHQSMPEIVERQVRRRKRKQQQQQQRPDEEVERRTPDSTTQLAARSELKATTPKKREIIVLQAEHAGPKEATPAPAQGANVVKIHLNQAKSATKTPRVDSNSNVSRARPKASRVETDEESEDEESEEESLLGEDEPLVNVVRRSRKDTTPKAAEKRSRSTARSVKSVKSFKSEPKVTPAATTTTAKKKLRSKSVARLETAVQTEKTPPRRGRPVKPKSTKKGAKSVVEFPVSRARTPSPTPSESRTRRGRPPKRPKSVRSSPPPPSTKRSKSVHEEVMAPFVDIFEQKLRQLAEQLTHQFSGVASKKAPLVEKKSTPAEKKSMPAEKKSTPAERKSTPAERKSTPAEKKPQPVEEKTKRPSRTPRKRAKSPSVSPSPPERLPLRSTRAKSRPPSPVAAAKTPRKRPPSPAPRRPPAPSTKSLLARCRPFTVALKRIRIPTSTTSSIPLFNYTPCKKCDAKFKHKADWRKHQRTHHKRAAPAATLTCALCGRVYRCLSAIRDHMSTHVAPLIIACRVCGLEFTQSSTRDVHEAVTHVDALKKDSRSVICTLCHEDQPSVTALREHIQAKHQHTSSSVAAAAEQRRRESIEDRALHATMASMLNPSPSGEESSVTTTATIGQQKMGAEQAIEPVLDTIEEDLLKLLEG